MLLTVRNVGEELLPGGTAVEISPEPRPGEGVSFQRPMLFGRAVAGEECFWGIATEDIAPGHGGLVQVGGIAVIRGVRGTPNRFAAPKPDGYIHFASAGRAEVLYHTSYSSASDAVIYLGGGAAAGYGGMFGVTENEDDTVTVGAGMAITAFREGPKFVAETTLRKNASGRLLLVLLNARLEGGEWDLFLSIGEGLTGGYIPGRQICWPLARLTSGGYSFAQLWQGGVIDFSSRYYLG